MILVPLNKLFFLVHVITLLGVEDHHGLEHIKLLHSEARGTFMHKSMETKETLQHLIFVHLTSRHQCRLEDAGGGWPLWARRTWLRGQGGGSGRSGRETQTSMEFSIKVDFLNILDSS